MLKAHEKIARAIADGNSSEAALWMRKHIMDFRRGWEMASLSPGLPVDLPRVVADA
jgi:GntR family transcriptional regulator, transcriptional repressor for pyruvate dehydrogenase complex